MRVLKFIWLFIFIIVGVWVFVLFISPFLFKQGEVEVPNIVGLSEEEATKAIKDSSLSYQLYYIDGESLKVSYTMPQATAKVRKGYAINIYVEKPIPSKYNSFIGLFYEDNLQSIDTYCKKHHITYDVTYVLDSSHVSGTIINQSKSIDEFVQKEDTILFTVAVSNDYIEMPTLHGSTIFEAIKFFEDNQLIPTIIYCYAPFLEDIVVSQSVEAGKIIKKGNQFPIEITVSKGLPADLETINLSEFLESIEALEIKYDIIYLASSVESNKVLKLIRTYEGLILYVSK